MLRSAAIAIVKRGLGFRQTQDTAIISALQQAQRDLESGKTLPNWLVKSATITVTPGNPFVVLPTDFLRLHEEYEMFYNNTNGVPVYLPRKNWQEAYQAYFANMHDPDADFDVTASYPSVVVYLTKDSARLVPTPTALTSVGLSYYAKAVVLDSDVENAWLKYAANYLIGLAGMIVAGDLRDQGAMQKFTQMAKMGGQSYLGDVIEDELAGRPLIMGRNN